MAITIQSRKAKGRRLQQQIAQIILKLFPSLTNRDVQSAPMGTTGVDILLSQQAVELFPYACECKSQEGFSKLYDAMEQAKRNQTASTEPVVFIKSNGKDILAVTSAAYFFSRTS